MEIVMSNDDLAIELCSYLFGKNLAVAKCISKRWYSITSTPDFWRALISRVKELSIFYFQYTDDIIYPREQFLYMGDDLIHGNFLSLDFLPERVITMASSNGLLCCRSLVSRYDDVDPEDKLSSHSSSNKRLRHGSNKGKFIVRFPPDVKLYVCNPFTKQWALVNSTRYYDVTIPLAMTVCLSSTSADQPTIKLVSVRCINGKRRAYTFMVYSSETKKWRRSKDICYCPSTMDLNKMAVIGSKCHWLMMDPYVMVFDVDREKSLVIDLPDPAVFDCDVYLGVSEGNLHYLSMDNDNLAVWVLKSYEKVEWELKHRQCLSDLFRKYFYGRVGSVLGIRLLGMQGDKVFLYAMYNVRTYNLRTKTLAWWCSSVLLGNCFYSSATLVPLTMSLASVDVLK